MPVKVPLEKSVVGGVELSALLAGWDRGAVVTTGDLDVEGLRPELPLANITIVVDRHDFRAEDIVAARDFLGDGDTLGIVVVVENGISAPVADLALLGALGVAA